MSPASPGILARMWRPIAMLIAAALAHPSQAQLGDARQTFSNADSLRGGIGPHRAWWNVVGYDVSVSPDFATRSITGRTVIAFDAVTGGQRMQIDLQQPLVVDSILTDVADFKDGAIVVRYTAIPFTRTDNIVWVDLPQAMKAGEATTLTIHYHGVPRAARNPPWDGGWIWTTDDQGNPWMSVACQGLGASVWYPCKDHQSDEPEYGASLRITAPDSLQAIGNGRLRSTVSNGNGTSTWHWQVKSPINTYNLVPYIGRYAHWHEVFAGVEGPLDCDYWVLARNVDRARAQFKQVPAMLTCFEERLGPYPFYADGYKLVEAPHLGMEHQSAIAYGNRFMNGYLGTDLSGTGHGLTWDYIIVHESGHEWFGNSITTADIADMWVHEGFTMYTEVLFVECTQGAPAADAYVAGLRRSIRNDRPLIGPYGVNEEGSGDMYPKGANLIHTIRAIVGDSTFRAMLLEMNRRFRHSLVTSAEVEAFIIGFSARTKALLNPGIFDQYLRTTKVPVLEWGRHRRRTYARWSNCLPGFTMPVRLDCGGLEPVALGTTWRSIACAPDQGGLQVDRNWYVLSKQVSKHALKRQISRKRIAHPKP